MATNREPLGVNWDNRLWLAGGRNGMPTGTLRRAVGVAPELTGSVWSRWGSLTLYAIPAISVFKWNGHRYAYDGASFFQDGVAILTGFTGGRLTFVEMPPQIGLQDYLFVLGGGKLFKLAPDGTITNWGIVAPGGSPTAQNGSVEQIIIDNMTVNNTGQWVSRNCTLSFDSDADDPFLAGGAYKVVTNAGGAPVGPTYIRKTYATPQDWSQYPDGTISLQSDIISFFANLSNPRRQIWMWLMVDVSDGKFKADYYKLVIQLLPSTNSRFASGANVIIVPDPGRWVQIAAAKAQFQRIGSQLNLDWSTVKAVQFQFGNPIPETPQWLLNGLQLYGGFPLGIGPAALLGGSTYKYLVTFGNSVTGSDSNPNGMQVQPDGTVNPPTPSTVNGVALNPVNLSNLPVSSDPQVNNRKLWRTTAGGSLFSYLDTIADNVTTTYTDVTGDLPGQPVIVTPWRPKVSAPVGYKVDGGNGFWFRVHVDHGPGVTGPNIPTWNIPPGPFLGDWVPWLTYAVGDWVNYLGVGYLAALQNRSVTPTSSPTTWTPLGTTNDGSVVWAWGGLNAVRTLALSNNLKYDNQQPLLSYGDVAGPFEGSLFWTQDSTIARKGWIYASPPGRPESVGTSFVAGSDDDPSEKVVIWDQLPWSLSTKRAFIIQGSYPAFSPTQIKSALGTEFPFTVVSAQNGIYYRGPDGIRMLDRAGSVLVGFAAIATILRGQTSENVSPFKPIWAAIARDEIYFGDGLVTFSLGGQSPLNLLQAPGFVWRMLGQALNCAYYEREDDEIIASFSGNTVLFEHPGALRDGP